jgi:hypothetical protein
MYVKAFMFKKGAQEGQESSPLETDPPMTSLWVGRRGTFVPYLLLPSRHMIAKARQLAGWMRDDG